MNSNTVIYDYIICGGGCAGLSLAIHLCNPSFQNKNVLVIDRDAKDQNDRTWCFWEKATEKTYYKSIISNEWPKIRMSGSNSRMTYDLNEWRYKRIRAIDFYELAMRSIDSAPHIHFKQDEITAINEEKDQVTVLCKRGEYSGKLCFSSIPVEKYSSNEYYLKQHFLGWEIEFEEDTFDTDVVDLMDFRMPQKEEVRFFYTLPFSVKRALIEFTIFSERVFDGVAEYEEYLERYIDEHFRGQKFKILDKENGVIPMTTHSFHKSGQSKIIHIGNLSGRVKPSSGYAFSRIQEEVHDIITELKKGKKQIGLNNKNRFLFYDKILFNVITRGRLLGADIFLMLFERNRSVDVLTFLNEKTDLWQEIKIFSSLPFLPFFRAMISEVKRLITDR